MNQFYSALTMIFDFMATGIGEPDMLITGIGSTALTVLIIMIAIVGWMKSPKQDREDVKNYLRDAVSLGHVGEHVSYEDEEDEFENPAIADSMPQSKPETIAFLAKKPQNRRLYLMATVFENEGHTADFTTKRRIPRKGRVEQYRPEDCSVLVNQSGNRHWVRP